MTEQPDGREISSRDRLHRIAEAMRAGEPPPSVSVRAFLGWFGAYRRGFWIVRGIRAALEIAGLRTAPDFESAYIDSEVRFVLVDEVAPAAAAEGATAVVAESVLVTEPEPALVSIGVGDPTYRLSKLASASKPPEAVAPDRPVSDAVTIMLANDFSQLPVMTNERTVKGMISWRSIGARWALNRAGSAVRDFMDDAFEIAADRSVFAAIPTIVEQGYVLVRDAANKISGIVTTADLSLEFQQLAEPFLLLGVIENHVRRLIDGRFTKDELAQARDPADSGREVETVADLAFGEYIRLLQEPTRWQKIGLAIDRTMFCKDLDAVRVIRNDVMHFDPDPLPEPNLATLRRFARFLQTIQSLGV